MKITTNLFIKFLCLFACFFILGGCLWIYRSFGTTTMDQIIYHLQFGSEGLLSSDKEVIWKFIRYCFVFPFLIATAICLLTPDLTVRLYKALIHVKNQTFAQLGRSKIGKSLLLAPHVYALTSALIYAGFHFSAYSYVASQLLPFHDDLFEKHYVPASEKLIQPSSRKNLILIYVESLETTYQNSELFKKDLLHPLDKSFIGGIGFEKQRQTQGTGWTMAGIVATQCGIPLKPAFGGMGDKRRNEATQNSNFLPNVKCLGDILKANGYHNVFLGGASLTFAGKGSFFRTHGYDEVYGKEELEKQHTSRITMNNWGLYDDDIFDIADQKLAALHSSGKQYNLTILTLDMHQPEGHLSNTCKMKGANNFEGIVDCTADMIAGFIERAKARGYLDNTTVVIMGDHLVMINPIYNRILQSPERFVFNRYISPIDGLAKNRDEITHFDHFPSILDSIGLNVGGGKLGLGISGFQQNIDIKDNSERFKWLDENITKSSDTYQTFWSR